MKRTPVAQPFCAPCIHFDGGACPVLRFVLDLHGQTPVVDCAARETADESTTTAGDAPAEEQ